MSSTNLETYSIENIVHKSWTCFIVVFFGHYELWEKKLHKHSFYIFLFFLTLRLKCETDSNAINREMFSAVYTKIQIVSFLI